MLFIELLRSSAWYLYLTLGIFGLIIGSFVNVVIHRVPVMLGRQWKLESLEALHPDKVPEKMEPYNLMIPASNCPDCGHKIKPLENIPVLSYLFLKGRCSSCRRFISARYPVVEITSALLALLAGVYFGVSLQTVLVCILLWTLLALSVIDLDTQFLPDNMTLPLLWLGLLANTAELFVPLTEAVTGAAAGYLFLWSVYWLFKLCTGKEGMGYGDFKLLAALGAWLGWHMLPVIILLSSLVGTFVGVLLIILRKHQRDIPIPFGPYLAAAGVIALFWGDAIIQSYFRFAGF